MTWTYSVNDLATNEIDALRLEISDTDINAQLLQNEEIAFAITQERNHWAAAARCCEMAATTFLRKVDVKLGRAMQIAYSKTAEQYFARAKSFRLKAMGTVVPYVGGMNASDYQAIAQNTGLISPLFTKEMMENPWTGGYSSDSIAPTTNDATPLDGEDG